MKNLASHGPTALLSVGVLVLTQFCSMTTQAQITERKLTASDGANGDLFGSAVSISGEYAIVGSLSDDDNGTNSGSAYIFRREGADWVEDLKLLPSDGAREDGFGFPVAISGDYAIVGSSLDDDNGNASGSVYIYRRSETGWIEDVKLTPSDGDPEDRFGHAFISGDLAIVGAYLDSDMEFQAGAAYIFRRDGDDWIEEAKLIASDGQETDFFGFHVAISEDYAVVGAFNADDHFGSAYIFRYDGSTWVEDAKLTARNRADIDHFGFSVSISGDYVLVGCENDDDKGTDSGSAYVFRREGNNWIEETKLTAIDGAAGDNFGCSVSLSGEYAIIGAVLDDDNGSLSGSAYIFRREGSNWIEEAKLVASDGATFDFFGNPVAISDGYVIVGANSDDDHGNGSGSAYVYTGFQQDQDDISADIIVDSTSVPVPPEGGDINFQTVLASLREDTLYLPISVHLVWPDGDTVSVVPDKTVHFAPNETLVKERYHRIPGDAPSGMYSLFVSWVNEDGRLSSASTTFEKRASGSASARDREWANAFAILSANYPNPFNPITTITFSLPRSGATSLKIFNALGEEVATLVSGDQEEGHYTVQWDASTQPSGVYFYRLQAGDLVETRKLVLMR